MHSYSSTRRYAPGNRDESLVSAMSSETSDLRGGGHSPGYGASGRRPSVSFGFAAFPENARAFSLSVSTTGCEKPYDSCLVFTIRIYLLKQANYILIRNVMATLTMTTVLH